MPLADGQVVVEHVLLAVAGPGKHHPVGTAEPHGVPSDLDFDSGGLLRRHAVDLMPRRFRVGRQTRSWLCPSRFSVTRLHLPRPAHTLGEDPELRHRGRDEHQGNRPAGGGVAQHRVVRVERQAPSARRRPGSEIQARHRRAGLPPQCRSFARCARGAPTPLALGYPSGESATDRTCSWDFVASVVRGGRAGGSGRAAVPVRR